ncbi:DUF2798 domain-containing protein [Janthinobacterium sp. HLX7-2]|uniref:DUF2798 domain-containing protein n=1 Tax=Janthinobacterium sp. HLX7-2 TaxID=1259331 RepID=UPI003F229363
MPAPSVVKRPSLTFRQILPDLILLPSIALLLSGIMTWANVGLGDAFFPRWGRGFLTSLLILPLILVCLGVLEKGVDRAMGGAHWVARKLVVALLTACLIESVLALAVTAINHGVGDGFGAAWWVAFSRSLPAGVVIGLFMCFYMKPKMDSMRAAARAAA